MESRRIVAGAVLLATLFVLGLSSVVFSCIPGDSGNCESRVNLRISWLGGSGKSNATIILADNLDSLEQSLREFASRTSKSGWGKTDETIGAETNNNSAIRLLSAMPLAKWTDVELDRAIVKIYERSPEESFNRAHRLALIAAEQERRLSERAAEAAAALLPKTVTVVRTAQRKAPAAPAAPAVAAVAGSKDPYNAPAPTGQWAYIEPHTTVWYRVNDGWRRLNVWMNDNHAQGLTLAIYGPDQTDVWSGKPAGMGTPGAGFDFWWTGRAAVKGLWTLRLTNTTDHAMPYNLNGGSFSETAGDMCRNCHGNIQSDQFDKCQHPGSWCKDLKREYKGK